MVFSSVSLSADEFSERYGNGVVHIATDTIGSVEFYSAPGSAVTHVLSFTPGAWSEYAYFTLFDDSATVPKWFSTLFLMKSQEYARVDIAALDSAQGYYRTILKDDQGREVWVKKARHVSFLSWFGFYSQMASIEMINDTVILFEKPDIKAQRVNYTSIYGRELQGTMTPLRTNGYWMEVEYQIITNDPIMNVQKYKGWILWRDDKRPLISYNLMGC